MTGLYIHIPFCKKKCSYCDFVSYGGREDTLPSYLDALKKEAEEYKNEKIGTVFIGGGTPSLLLPGQMTELLSFIAKNFFLKNSTEVTVECNPQSVTDEKMREYKRSGINRISMGAQSLSDRVLGEIGRAHTLAQLESAIESVKNAGFCNFNLDLISALPGQSVEMWEETLNKAVQYDPTHISCYSLTVEPATPMGKAVENGDVILPDEESEREMYYKTREILKKNGFMQYEISNYAKSGFECRHNINYWECGEYIGIGCGAHSCFSGARYSNTKSLEQYIAGSGRRLDYQILSREDKIEERIMLGLRMNRGIDVLRFEKDFGIDFCKEYSEKIKKCGGLVLFDGKYLRLTEKGRDFCDTVALEFCL